MQISVLSGLKTDATAEFRDALPHNLVPVPKDSTISAGYLRSADGIDAFAAGPGTDRGGIVWNGTMYRVMGRWLVSIDAAGAVATLGDVGDGGPVTLDYSFDRLAIASGGHLFYWDGSALTQVTDPDLRYVKDVQFADGYYVTTDGTYIVTTELADPTSVLPLKYGSSEADPDPVQCIFWIRSELLAVNRNTIELFSNVGGTGFPFSPIKGAMVPKGAVGTHGCARYLDTLAFVGSARDEPLSVHLLGSGTTQRIATREIDTILAGYAEDALAAGCVVESRVDRGNQFLLVHLPDITLVYDAVASAIAGMGPVWHTLGSGAGTPYRARFHTWAYGGWFAGDPTSSAVGHLVSNTDAHYGTPVEWRFGTPIVYNRGGAIIHELELVSLTGRAIFGAQPVVWLSCSDDGLNWSQERAAAIGRQGDTGKRVVWRGAGIVRHWRAMRFRGVGTGRVAFVRLNAAVEALNG